MKIVSREFGAASITNPASTMGLMLTHYKKRHNITRYVEKLLYSKCILQFFSLGRLRVCFDWRVRVPPSARRRAIGGSIEHPQG